MTRLLRSAIRHVDLIEFAKAPTPWVEQVVLAPFVVGILAALIGGWL